MNLGDEVILDGIISQFRKSLPAEITVFSRNPHDTLARHDVERAIPVRDLTRKEISPDIARLDIFVLGGGGILFDAEAEVYLREVYLAHELGVPVAVYGISAGPLTSSRSRQGVRNALNSAAMITVRDRQAYRLLEDAGVDREIHLTADPALLVEPEPVPIEMLKAEGIQFDRHLVGFSV
jgi:polysaccharide pyruvyl transferase WcaK-like protein